MTEPAFFPTPDDFRAWLADHHATESELLVGFYKTGSGKLSITWPESVDQALCFGWIDGVRRSLGPEAYTIRFTPRKPTSNWSRVNIEKVAQLIEAGLMQPAGLAAFEARREDKSGVYSFEQKHAARLPPDWEARFQADGAAWQWFQSQPPWYRRTAVHWVMQAKREETRLRRFEALLKDSANGQRIGAVPKAGG